MSLHKLRGSRPATANCKGITCAKGVLSARVRSSSWVGLLKPHKAWRELASDVDVRYVRGELTNDVIDGGGAHSGLRSIGKVLLVQAWR